MNYPSRGPSDNRPADGKSPLPSGISYKHIERQIALLSRLILLAGLSLVATTAAVRTSGQTSPKTENSMKTIRLWASEAPGAKGAEDADIPTLTVYNLPESKRNGAAVIVCPGGG